MLECGAALAERSAGVALGEGTCASGPSEALTRTSDAVKSVLGTGVGVGVGDAKALPMGALASMVRAGVELADGLATVGGTWSARWTEYQEMSAISPPTATIKPPNPRAEMGPILAWEPAEREAAAKRRYNHRLAPLSISASPSVSIHFGASPSFWDVAQTTVTVPTKALNGTNQFRMMVTAAS